MPSCTLSQAEHAILEPLSVSPPLWRENARRLLTIWRMPSFDPYASWTIYEASEIWVRCVVARQHHEPAHTGIDTYVADRLFDPRTALRLRDEIEALARQSAPPRASGVMLDGMRLGVRSESADFWWRSDLATPLNPWWAAAREALDAGMPASTVPIQNVHRWIEAGG